MSDIANIVREYVMAQLCAADFHNSNVQKSHMDYYDAAEEKINAMTNIELLELIDNAND